MLRTWCGAQPRFVPPFRHGTQMVTILTCYLGGNRLTHTVVDKGAADPSHELTAGLRHCEVRQEGTKRTCVGRPCYSGTRVLSSDRGEGAVGTLVI